MATGPGFALLTYTPDAGKSGTQRKTSKLQAFEGGCWRSAIVLPIIAVVCRAAGTIFAHPVTIFPPYSPRRLNWMTSCFLRSFAGRHSVQLKLGVSAMDSCTGTSVATPDR
jgi:hypothetical protein